MFVDVTRTFCNPGFEMSRPGLSIRSLITYQRFKRSYGPTSLNLADLFFRGGLSTKICRICSMASGARISSKCAF